MPNTLTYFFCLLFHFFHVLWDCFFFHGTARIVLTTFLSKPCYFSKEKAKNPLLSLLIPVSHGALHHHDWHAFHIKNFMQNKTKEYRSLYLFEYMTGIWSKTDLLHSWISFWSWFHWWGWCVAQQMLCQSKGHHFKSQGRWSDVTIGLLSMTLNPQLLQGLSDLAFSEMCIPLNKNIY